MYGAPKWALELLEKRRVGHLACASTDGKPLVVPICYVFNKAGIYSAIDEKPKRTSPRRLRRFKNIIENSKVSFVVDRYSEDWRKLQYVIVDGSARIITRGIEFRAAVRDLRRKYKKYSEMRIEHRPIIKIEPFNVV